MSDCLTNSDLHAFHAGELDEAAEARVREHLARCETCAQRDAELVAEHEALLGRVKGMKLSDTEERPSHRAASAPPVEIEGYEIVRELHRGGQGVVYQAVQKSTKRKVAIKVLLEGPYASKSARRRFEREIELVGQLKHPNIIGIFHSGQTPDGRQFCVMDYVRGVPLNQFVHDKKLPLEEALKLFGTVCDAVNYAHQKGVIHRDLKPSNILVDVDGTPKVLDFGLAKQLASPVESLVSVTGQVVGTLPYMSPEQARGNPDEIDIRTDVYALGVILYEMLTGHYPYPVVGRMVEVLKHIQETQPTPPTRQWKADSGVAQRSSKRLRPGECPIDGELQTVILKTLSKERQRRYQSAGELARDVGHYLAGEAIDAKRDSGWYILKKSLHRQRYRLGLVASILVAVLLTAGAFSFRVSAEREQRLSAQQQLVNEQETAASEREATLAAQQRLVEERENAAAEREAKLAAQQQLLEKREGFAKALPMLLREVAKTAEARRFTVPVARAVLVESKVPISMLWILDEFAMIQSVSPVHIVVLGLSPGITHLVSVSEDKDVQFFTVTVGDEFEVDGEVVRRMNRAEDAALLRSTGESQYRRADYKTALSMLQLATELDGENLATVALLAKTHYRLDQMNEAQAALERLRNLIENSEGDLDLESQALLTEAEALISGAPGAAGESQ